MQEKYQGKQKKYSLNCCCNDTIQQQKDCLIVW